MKIRTMGICMFQGIFWLASVAAAAEGARPLPAGSTAAPDEIVAPSSRDDRWHMAPALSFAARSDYVESANASAGYGSIAATAQLRFTSGSRPYGVALLLEYSLVEDRSNVAIFAALASYKVGDWAVSFAPYVSKLDREPGVWKQQSTGRYRVGRGAAVGIELVGPLTDLGASKLSAGYYRTVDERLSVTVTVGSGLDAGPDLAVRTALTWRVR